MAAGDTGRFAAYIDLYLAMVDMQLTFDALDILGYDMDRLQTVVGEFAFILELAHAGKVAPGRFIASMSMAGLFRWAAAGREVRQAVSLEARPAV